MVSAEGSAAASGSSGFVALPVSLTYAPQEEAVQRWLYLRAHQADKGASLPKDCALFVCGLPWRVGAAELEALLEPFGDVHSVALHPSQTSGVALFSSAAGREAALQAAAEGKGVALTLPEPEGPYGLKGWVEEHKAQFPGNAQLQQQLDEWMETHEAEEEQKRQEAQNAADDGWTVVTRQRGRRKNADASGTTVGAVAQAVAAARAAEKKPAAVADFYRFQKRERRRDALLELRRKFEEDKKRVTQLKASSRRFKPY